MVYSKSTQSVGSHMYCNAYVGQNAQNNTHELQNYCLRNDDIDVASRAIGWVSELCMTHLKKGQWMAVHEYRMNGR